MHLTARDWDRKLDEAMEALNRKGVTFSFGIPDWMARVNAEAHGAMPEYMEYRLVLEELSKAIDRERYVTGTPVQMTLNV